MGKLYVCATPIGNMEDITLRVLRILKEVDIIAAEDTRQSVKILNYYDIKTPLTSYHEHNKVQKGIKLVEMMKEGKDIAVVTDAGMPGISDPGEELIRQCYENDIPVTVVPGATAVVTAVVLSGLDCRRYCFEAFLPTDKKQRKICLERLSNETRTTVIYEAPHHLLSTLTEIYEYTGERKIAVIKELTKKHEDVKRGVLSEMISYYTENEPKGEFVIVIEGIDQKEIEMVARESFLKMSIEENFMLYINQGIDRKEAMKRTAKDRGVSKRDIYSYIVEKGI